MTNWEHTREDFENGYVGSEDISYYPYKGPLIYKSLTVQRAWEAWCRALDYAVHLELKHEI